MEDRITFRKQGTATYIVWGVKKPDFSKHHPQEMKRPVHDHDLYGSRPSQHTEEQLLVSSVTALSSSVISFTSPLFTSILSFSRYPSFQPVSLSYVRFHPCPLFLQHNSPRRVLKWRTYAASYSPLLPRHHSRLALWRKSAPVPFLLHFFPNFSINSFWQTMPSLFFSPLYRPSTATFTIQYQPSTSSLRQ